LASWQVECVNGNAAHVIWLRGLREEEDAVDTGHLIFC